MDRDDRAFHAERADDDPLSRPPVDSISRCPG